MFPGSKWVIDTKGGAVYNAGQSDKTLVLKWDNQPTYLGLSGCNVGVEVYAGNDVKEDHLRATVSGSTMMLSGDGTFLRPEVIDSAIAVPLGGCDLCAAATAAGMTLAKCSDATTFTIVS